MEEKKIKIFINIQCSLYFWGLNNLLIALKLSSLILIPGILCISVLGKVSGESYSFSVKIKEPLALAPDI